MRITIGSFTLYDDAEGWTLSDSSASIGRLIQEVGKIRATEIETKFRGLKKTDLTFTVSKPCEDEAAVLEEFLFSENEIPTSGVIAIAGHETGGGSREVYLRGHVQSTGARFVGRRVFKTFRIVGGAITATKPAA